MNHGSLFSGIGGFDLAAEWMGWNNVFHCEWNPFGQQVLKYYWPNAKSYGDITKTDFKEHANTQQTGRNYHFKLAKRKYKGYGQCYSSSVSISNIQSNRINFMNMRKVKESIRQKSIRDKRTKIKPELKQSVSNFSESDIIGKCKPCFPFVQIRVFSRV